MIRNISASICRHFLSSNLSSSSQASIRENNKCCKDVPEGQFCKADRAGILKKVYCSNLMHGAGPNEPDTSPNNWSPLNQGCERFRFISGADEIALNAEMGLYR